MAADRNLRALLAQRRDAVLKMLPIEYRAAVQPDPPGRSYVAGRDTLSAEAGAPSPARSSVTLPRRSGRHQRGTEAAPARGRPLRPAPGSGWEQADPGDVIQEFDAAVSRLRSTIGGRPLRVDSGAPGLRVRFRRVLESLREVLVILQRLMDWQPPAARGSLAWGLRFRQALDRAQNAGDALVNSVALVMELRSPQAVSASDLGVLNRQANGFLDDLRRISDLLTRGRGGG